MSLQKARTPSLAELATLGVPQVSWAALLHLAAIARFEDQLAALRERDSRHAGVSARRKPPPVSSDPLAGRKRVWLTWQLAAANNRA